MYTFQNSKRQNGYVKHASSKQDMIDDLVMIQISFSVSVLMTMQIDVGNFILKSLKAIKRKGVFEA